MTKKPVDYVWSDKGLDLSAYCHDCQKPANEIRHLERGGHHVYACRECAKRRLQAPALRIWVNDPKAGACGE